MVVHRSVLSLRGFEDSGTVGFERMCGDEVGAGGLLGILRRNGGTGLAMSKSGRPSSREDVSPS